MLNFQSLRKKYKGTIFDIDNDKLITNIKFHNHVENSKTLFHQSGIVEGSIVLLSTHSSVMFMYCFCGLVEIGAIPLIASKNITAMELDYYKNNYTINYIVSDFLNGKIVVHIGDADVYIQACNNELFTGKQLINKYGTVILHPTSGTTGCSKLCIRTEEACIWEPVNHLQTVGFSYSKILCMLQLNHAYGFGSAFLLGLLCSSDFYIMSEVNFKKIVRILTEYEIDYFPANSAVLNMLTKMKKVDKIHIPKNMLNAGFALNTEIARSFYHKFGVYIKSSYGSTETGEICIQTEDAILEFGNVGKPLVNTKIKLIPTEDGAMNVLGVNNPSMLKGYLLKGNKIEDDIFLEGNYVSTKDVVEEKNNSQIVLKARINDVINLFGIKVIPSEIEQVLLTVREIEDIYVYSEIDCHGTERMLIMVQTKLSKSKVWEICREMLPFNKMPSNIFIGEIPRNSLGKIKKDKLPHIGKGVRNV